MIALAWNCRGLGNPRAVRVLDELVRVHRPEVVFLSETLVGDSKMEEVRQKLKFGGCFSVAARGHSGGLCMLWKLKEQVRVVQYNEHCIDAMVTGEDGVDFRLTGFYGCPERHRRQESWDMLRRLGEGVDGPWCIIGDFNDIIHQHEQRGRNKRPQALIDGFRMAVAECNLVDIELEGYSFTWSRAKGKLHGVESRLDRAMVNAAWIDRFMHCKLRNLVAPISDHSPLLLMTNPHHTIKKKWRFRFENAWRREAEMREVVEEAWRGEPSDIFFRKLHACMHVLEDWGRGFARRFRAAISEKRRELEDRREDVGEEAAIREERCPMELLGLLQQEEDYWRQRAKQFWLKDGDRNTRFFHATANERRRWTMIKRLEDEEGRSVEDRVEMEGVVRRYFEDIFRRGGCNPETVTNDIDGILCTTDNDLLLLPFNKEEFRLAMFSMDADKAPGPDGLNPGFYQHFWHLIGDEVFKAACSWLEEGVLPSEIQDTNIVLLPKVDEPKGMKELRPISLCNVLYRLVAKVLANRLRRVMPKLISEEQSTFIVGRSIIDNVMVAFETIHSMKRR
ncbi:Transposon TX1 uncharacterized 149 kDa protein [Linum grandiflorum]